MQPTSTQSLARYVPALLLRRLEREPLASGTPVVEHMRGTLLFADISGFSALAERLSALGPEGAEAISRCLNTYFSQLIDLVQGSGGDIVKFAGDALLALWPAEQQSLADCARAAASCSLEVQRRLSDYAVGEDVYLSLRLCLGSGDISVHYLGGVLERWETLLVGPPFQQIREVKPFTEPGDVVASPLTAELLGADFVGRGVGDGAATRIEHGPHGLRGRPVHRPTLPIESLPALRSWLPGVILSRLAAGQSDWIGELRRISAIFVTLPVNDTEDADVLRLQSVVSEIQHAVYRHDGSIDKISIDEKGAFLVAAFGLPPLSHEDDPARAVSAALGIQAAMLRHGASVSIGIATGQVFCGTIGNQLRSEYTVIGSAVNLAARLMEAADEGIVCDGMTWGLCRNQHGFLSLGSRLVKGRLEPVPVYEPTGEAIASVRPQTAMVARHTERAALSERVQGLVRSQAGSTVVIVGEAGIGKSRLLGELHQQAAALGVRTLTGASNTLERSTPYHAWFDVMEQIFDIEGLEDRDERLARVRDRLGRSPELVPLEPLLEAVLPLDLEDNDLTRQMLGESRATKTNALIAGLLASAALEQPTLIILEDAHWLDSGSWALLKTVHLDVKPLMLVVATRPMPEPTPPEFIELLAEEKVHIQRLEGLSRQDTGLLVCQRLGVKELPPTVARLIHERAGGNALFIEELAYVLRDTGCLAVDGDECRLAVSAEELSRTRLPATVEGLVVSRIDRLSTKEQLLLKVASVVGRLFAVQIVRDVFPVEIDRAGVATMLPALVDVDMLRADTNAAHLHYLFKHILAQEAVYGLMLFSQRRGLHRAVAEWYEGHVADDIERHYPLLAHHWQRAENWTRAVDYLEHAGEQAIEHYANREAIEMFQRAFALDAEHPVGATEARYASWERHLAEAWFRLGNLAECQHHGRRAMRLLGFPVPSTVIGTLAGLLGQIGRRVLQRILPRWSGSKEDAQRERRLQATRVLNRLTEIHIYAEDALGCLDSGLRELNIAEPVGPSAELGRAYAILAVVLGTVPLHRICRVWAERALEVTEAAGNTAALAYVLSRVAIYGMYVCDWPTAEQRLRRSAEIAREFGDRRGREEAIGVLGITLFYAGRFREMPPLMEQLRVSARYSSNEQIQGWSLLGMAGALLRLGRAKEALKQIEEAMAWVETKASHSEVLWALGLLSLAHLRLGQLAEARRVADRALPLAEQRPVAYWTQQSHAALAETYLGLRERARASAREQAELAKASRRACKAMRRFGSTFPFGKPHGLLWTGLCQWLDGRHDVAQATWARCLAVSEASGMPYERALALREIGRHMPPGSAEHHDHLRRACSMLDAMGAEWDLDQARAAWRP